MKIRTKIAKRQIHENLHKMWMKTRFTFLCKFSWVLWRAIKATNMLQLYTADFNLFKMYHFFPNFDGSNAFSHIQQAKMPTIADILTCMSMINFIINWVEQGKNFITSGPGHPPSLIRMFVRCTNKALGISFLWALKTLIILMHLQMQPNVWLDNVTNLRTVYPAIYMGIYIVWYILRYTVVNPTSLRNVAFHWLTS